MARRQPDKTHVSTSVEHAGMTPSTTALATNHSNRAMEVVEQQEYRQELVEKDEPTPCSVAVTELLEASSQSPPHAEAPATNDADADVLNKYIELEILKKRIQLDHLPSSLAISNVVAELSWSDLDVGRFLGSGAFRPSTVCPLDKKVRQSTMAG